MLRSALSIHPPEARVASLATNPMPMISNIPRRIAGGLLLLLLVTNGCRSASYSTRNSTHQFRPIEPGHAVVLRMPDEGQYPPVLFWKPRFQTASGETPEGWTGAWIQGDTAQKLMQETSGLIVIPTMVASGLHSFFGAALYHATGTSERDDHAQYSENVSALANAARAREFERDLKTHFESELARRKLVVVANSSTDHRAAATIDIRILRAGMTGRSSRGSSRNPNQSFELVVGTTVTQQGVEAHLDQVAYISHPARFNEWARGNAEKLAFTREEALRSVAQQLAEQIIPYQTR